MSDEKSKKKSNPAKKCNTDVVDLSDPGEEMWNKESKATKRGAAEPINRTNSDHEK